MLLLNVQEANIRSLYSDLFLAVAFFSDLYEGYGWKRRTGEILAGDGCSMKHQEERDAKIYQISICIKKRLYLHMKLKICIYFVILKYRTQTIQET